jgi:iron-sulfur cluster assembly protein
MTTKEHLIEITNTAINKIKQNLKTRGRGRGIHIGIRTTGCSGLAYTLEYLDSVDNLDPGYQRVVDDFCIYISEKDMPYFKDLEIDYVRQGLNEGFEFRNQAEKDRCGCGESFRV